MHPEIFAGTEPLQNGLLFGTGFALSLVMMVVLLFSLLFGVLEVIARWRLFCKAGEKGWKSLIPVYTDYLLYKIAWRGEIYWIGLALAVVASILSSLGHAVGVYLTIAVLAISYVLYFLNLVKLARAFGHGVGFAVGMFFFPVIFMLILGFERSQYLGPQ